MKHFFILFLLGCYISSYSQMPSYVPANGLMGFWPFNNNANDASGNNNNGAVQGATPTTDRFGNTNAAYNFNGTTDYITVPDNPSLSGFNDMSISVWINTNELSTTQGIVCKWYQVLNCGNYSDTYEAALDGNKVQFATNNTNINGFAAPPILTNADVNAWKHIVYINNATQGGSIYINGVLAATESVTGGICPSTNVMYFGADLDGHINAVYRYFNGKIDDIGIWNRVITACEIKQLYTASFVPINDSCRTITGIKKNDVKDAVTVYPNPTTGSISVNGIHKACTLEVTNTLGQTIYKSKTENNTIEIDLTNEAKGVYVIKLDTGNETTFKKIIKE